MELYRLCVRLQNLFCLHILDGWCILPLTLNKESISKTEEDSLVNHQNMPLRISMT